MTIEKFPCYIWVSFGRNDLLIETSDWDWKQWSFDSDGAFAIVTPLFTFWPWFSRATISEEQAEALTAEITEKMNSIKAKLSALDE